MSLNSSISPSPRKILIYRLGSLGDTIIALPCFHHIRQCFPDASLALLTNKPVMSKAAPLEAVLGKDYFFQETLTYPVGTRNALELSRLLLEIRSRKFDLVINITAPRSRFADRRDRLFFAAAGIRKFIGFNLAPADYRVQIDPETGAYEWEAKRLARKISSLGPINLALDQYWDLMLTADERKLAETVLEPLRGQHRIIVMNAGTKMPVKDWGRDNWLELMRRLGKKAPAYRLVIIGVNEESAFADECLQAWGMDGLNLCGRTSPRVSAAVSHRADVFIGHDSGPLHLAACMGTPCVGIYACINQPRQWFPRGENNILLFPETECAANGINECTNPGGRCVLGIKPDQVETAVMSVLSKLKF